LHGPVIARRNRAVARAYALVKGRCAMSATGILLAIVLAAAVWHVVATILIFESLRWRGQAASFLWLRLMAPVYAGRYRELTIAETGRTGPLFYHWIASINIALVAAIVLLALGL
jgi:hypothetical protein